MEEQRQGQGQLPGHPGLYVASGLMNFAGALAMVSLCYYAKDHLDANLMQLGVITFLGNFVYVSLCPLLGTLSDRYGRRPFIVSSTLVFASAYFGAYLSTQVWHLYVVTAFSGLGHALFWPAVEAELAAEADSYQLRRRVGRFNISWSIGDIPGALVAGLAYDWQPQLPFLIAAATGVAISAMNAVIRISAHTEETRTRHRETVSGHAVPRDHVTFWRLALLANFFSAGLVSIVRRLFPDLAVEALRYTGTQWGLLVMMVAISRTVVFAIMERRHGWLYRPKRLFFVQLLFPTGCLLIIFAQSYWTFILAFACIGAASGVVYFSSLYYSVHGAGSQAQRAGLHESVLGLGAGVIPLVASSTRRLSEPHWGDTIRAPYLAGAALALLSISIQAVILARSRRAAPQAETP